MSCVFGFWTKRQNIDLALGFLQRNSWFSFYIVELRLRMYARLNDQETKQHKSCAWDISLTVLFLAAWQQQNFSPSPTIIYSKLFGSTMYMFLRNLETLKKQFFF